MSSKPGGGGFLVRAERMGGMLEGLGCRLLDVDTDAPGRSVVLVVLGISSATVVVVLCNDVASRGRYYL